MAITWEGVHHYSVFKSCFGGEHICEQIDGYRQIVANVWSSEDFKALQQRGAAHEYVGPIVAACDGDFRIYCLYSTPVHTIAILWEK